MPHEIKIPDLGADIEDVTIAEWHIEVGAAVSAGDILADIETDKATIELEADADGVVGALLVPADETPVAPGAPVALLLLEGEDPGALEGYSAGEATASVDEGQRAVPVENTEADYDVIVIGSGPGGYVAAIRAAQLKLRTAVVEREDLGGVCLNWGCIPTKTLLRSAEVYENMKHADEFGLAAEGLSFDIPKIVERSRRVAGKLNAGVKHLLKKNKVDVIEGDAHLLGKGRVSVKLNAGETREVTAGNILLATGARTRVLPGLEPDGKLVWTYRDAMTPDSVPESLLIIGAGAIGVEFASFFNSFGAKVTLVEMQDSILPVEDAEISAFAAKSFEKQGIEVLTRSRVNGLERGDDHVVATIDVDGDIRTARYDKVISAVGVVGNHEELGLENTAVELDGPFVAVDEWSQTAEPGVFAIGDLAGAPCLAHKASHEGITCVEYIAGMDKLHPVDRTRVPGCTYSRPQVASVGMTEVAAREAGRDVRIGRFPFQGNGKAIALGEAEGLVKTVFDAKTGELLGAHMVGAEVTELIQGFGIAQTLETTEHELMETIFPHPTLSEMMHEATLDAYERVIHF
jgi:dihydrolipoamide dehydrogenase